MLQLLMLIVTYPESGFSDWAPIDTFPQLNVKLYDYVEAIANESKFDETGPLPTPTSEKQEPTPMRDTEFDWTLMNPGEVPFVAILFQPTQREPTPREVKPKNACGGILVSPDLIVTPCGCIMSFMGQVAGKRQKPSGKFKFDMDAVDANYNFNNVGVNRIYAVFSQYEFDAENRDHYLDDRVNNLITTQQCYHQTVPFWTSKGERPKSLDPKTVDAILAYWRLEPAISYPTPGQFMPWPPNPIIDQRRITGPPEIVVISGTGFKTKRSSFTFPDEFYDRTNFLIRGVNILFEHCYVSSEQCPQRRDKTTCFCALHRDAYELCGGTIGWPVVNENNEVVGLTVSNRECEKWHGSVLVAAFYPEIAKEIAAAAGSWQKLVEQNSKRPPLYREDPWMMKAVQLYDYSDEFDEAPRSIMTETNDSVMSLKSDFGWHSFTVFVFPICIRLSKGDLFSESHHLKITETLGKANKLFGIQTTVNCAQAFSYLLTHTYYLSTYTKFEAFPEPEYKKALQLHALFSIIMFYELASSCESAASEVEEFNCELVKVLQTNEGIRRNERLKLYVMVAPSIELNGCGFFHLGYSLVTSVITATATYVIVLVQFT